MVILPQDASRAAKEEASWPRWLCKIYPAYQFGLARKRRAVSTSGAGPREGSLRRG
jgi:hypothetical protein